jgi:hypothetical protein
MRSIAFMQVRVGGNNVDRPARLSAQSSLSALSPARSV